jgi:C1A family cysteine protease
MRLKRRRYVVLTLLGLALATGTPVMAEPVIAAAVTAPLRAPSRVLLTRSLPPVGDQGSENSCVGWAVGYAGMSYLEARAHHWRPDRASHQFSPAFLYNQLDHQQDHGTSVTDALKLIKARGCATLATMPYHATDFKLQPAAAAFQEAAHYRNIGWRQLRTGAAIRAELRQGHIVVLVIQVDPEFQGGKFSTFTAARRQQGLAAGGTAAGGALTHAVCIVGYDNARQAFLLMNSWGRQWGSHGFCWVSYSLLERVAPESKFFGRDAYALFGTRTVLQAAPRP